MPYWKVWKMHIFADCPSCEDVASSQRHWGSKTSQKTKITKRRTKSSCCAAYWPSKTFISLQLFVGKKRARLQPSWTWLTLPVPEENTCAASSELCNWGPQHRCYQSLWHRSQPEHMGQVSGSVNKRVWSPIVSVPWQPPPPHTQTHLCRQIKRLWFWFFFSVKWDLSTIIHSFPVWGGEPALGAFGNRYWFWAEKPWLLFPLCQNTQEPPWTRNTEQHLVCELNWGRKNAYICQYIHNMSPSALYHRHALHKVLSVSKDKRDEISRWDLTQAKEVYFWVWSCMWRRGKPCKRNTVSAWVWRSLIVHVRVLSVCTSGLMWW